MNRTAARHIAPALIALALLAGCGDDSSDATSDSAASPAQGQDSALCTGYAELQKAVEDLRSDPIDPSATPEEVQQQAAEMSAKAASVKASLSKLSALSDGPVAAAVGEMNMKADELRESLTEAAASAQESMGPKITEAQTELNAAYDDVTEAIDEKCPAN
jgi:hypothetical protein